MLIFGVDFSSSPSARKPITVAAAWIESIGWSGSAESPEIKDAATVSSQRRLELLDFAALESLGAFESFLLRDGPWVGGFDLPFGQPRELIERMGWPLQWPSFIEFFCSQSRQDLRETFRKWCDARPTGSKFAWRSTDRPAGSSPAMRWTNPPVAWMMQAGIGRMHSAGLWFPAHHHPAASAEQTPFEATIGNHRVALEAYPGFWARKATRASYKSDEASKQTLDRRQARQTILSALEAGSLFDISLSATASLRRRMIEDGSGDWLDATLCAMQAAWAFDQRNWGLPSGLDPLEGWITTVPAPLESPDASRPLQHRPI